MRVGGSFSNPGPADDESNESGGQASFLRSLVLRVPKGDGPRSEIRWCCGYEIVEFLVEMLQNMVAANVRKKF